MYKFIHQRKLHKKLRFNLINKTIELLYNISKLQKQNSLLEKKILVFSLNTFWLQITVTDTLIPIINSLQDVFATVSTEQQTIDLPQIVVVGSQSAGKSSVLEAICGRDILPRGSGIVTRRPLILQLNKTKPGQVVKTESGKEILEWGEFQHTGDKKFIRYQDICKEIVDETDRITGNSKNVSTVPINCRLYGPTLIPLTLVDLPGLVKNVLPGQPPDIDVQIYNCVYQYINKPNAIILAVSAANADLAVSDALNIATKVDPEGERTLGVLTKVDIIDKGNEENIIKILNNEDYKLKLGWVAVQNRSQKDIEQNKEINKHLKDEMAFFATHQYFKTIANRCGVLYLSKRLNQVLINHIQRTLPDLKMKVNAQLDKFTKELISYGNIPDDQQGKERMLLNLITKYEHEYKDIISGQSAKACKSELVGGARIGYIFKTVLPKMFDTISINQMLKTEDVRTLIRNSSGLGSGMFLSDTAFELLCSKMIRQLEGPCKQCLQLVKMELITIARSIPTEEMKAFKTLSRDMVGITCMLIENLSRPTGKFLQDCITAELAFINSNHPDFLSSPEFRNSVDAQRGMVGLAPVQQPQMQQPQMMNQVPGQQIRMQQQPRMQPGGPQAPNMPMQHAPMQGQPQMPGQAPNQQPQMQQQRPEQSQAQQQKDAAYVPDVIKASGEYSEMERLGLDLIPRLLSAYFKIIRKKVEDTVPKAIVAFLINASREQLQETLVRTLYQPSKYDQLLDEDPVIREKRMAARQMVDVLGKAQKILDKIGDIRSIEDVKGPK